MAKQFGYVALIGLPNSGKSTLLNKLLGRKIAGVSRKAHTTRSRVQGVLSRGNSQVVFLDCPGFQSQGPKDELQNYMSQETWDGLANADLVCFLTDGVKGWSRATDRAFHAARAGHKGPFLVAISKWDQMKAGQREEAFTDVAKRTAGSEVELVRLSSKSPGGTDELLSWIDSVLPEDVWHYGPEGEQRVSRIIFEVVMEKVFRCMGQEIPYQCTFRLNHIGDISGTLVVDGSLVVSRPNLRKLVVGKGGQKIKEIGCLARVDLERQLGAKVMLKLKVETNRTWNEFDQLINPDLSELDHGLQLI